MTSLFRQFIRNKIIGHIVLILVLIAIILISIWTRALIGSKKNFAEGEEYFNDREYIKAITFFDRSMHWYTTFNPYIERSAEYLWKISEKAEEINDDQLSMIALETIRNSFYSSRSFFSPGADWIKRCDDKIQDIIKNQKEEIFKVKDEFKSQDKINKQLIIYNDPNIFWIIVLEIGLLGWIGAVLGFIFFYLGPCVKSDRYIHTSWFWILIAAINYSLWVIGIIKA